MSNSRSGACWPSMLISIDYLGAGALVVCTLHWQTISLVNVRVAVSAICIHLSHAFVPFFFFFSVLENSIESIHLNCFNSYWSDDFPKDELDLNCKWGLSWFLSIWARNEEKCWSSLVLIWWINDGTGQHTHLLLISVHHWLLVAIIIIFSLWAGNRCMWNAGPVAVSLDQRCSLFVYSDLWN